MSYKVAEKVNGAIIGDRTMKAVIRCFADHANHQGGNSFPGVDTVARETEMGVRTVQRALRKAEREGWLVVERKASQHRPTTYRVNVEKLDANQGCHSDTSESLQGCQRDTPEKNPGVTSSPSRGVTVTPESEGKVIESTTPRADARATDPRFWTWLERYPVQPTDTKAALAAWDEAMAAGTDYAALVAAADRLAKSPEVAAPPEDWLRHRGWTYPVPAPPEPEKPAAKRRGHPAVTAFCDAYLAAKGRKYAVTGRDARALKALWADIGEQEFTARLPRYLASADPFIVRLGHAAWLFPLRVNDLAGSGLVPPGMVVSDRELQGLQVVRNAARFQEQARLREQRRAEERRAIEEHNDTDTDEEEESA